MLSIEYVPMHAPSVRRRTEVKGAVYSCGDDFDKSRQALPHVPATAGSFPAPLNLMHVVSWAGNPLLPLGLD
jgi:hypothetical protein